MKQLVKNSIFVLGMAMAVPTVGFAAEKCEEPFEQLAIAAKANAILAESEAQSGRDVEGVVTESPADIAAAAEDEFGGMFDDLDDTEAMSGDVGSGMFDGEDGLDMGALVDMLAGSDGEQNLLEVKTQFEKVEDKWGLTKKQLAVAAAKDAKATFTEFSGDTGIMAFLNFGDNILSDSKHTKDAIERLRGEDMEKLGDAGEVMASSLETVLMVVNEGVHPDKIEEVLAQRAEAAENPDLKDRMLGALKIVRAGGASAVLTAMRSVRTVSAKGAVNTLKSLGEAVTGGNLTESLETELEQYTNSVAGFVEKIRQPFASQMATVQSNIERVEQIYEDLYRLQVTVETKKATAILMINALKKRKSQLNLNNKGDATIAKQLDLAIESLTDKVEAWKGALLGMDTDRLVLQQLHANFIRLLRTAKLTLDVQMTRFVANLEKIVMIKDANALAASLQALRRTNNDTMKAIADQMTEAITKINELSRVSSVDLEATKYVIDKIKAMQNNIDEQNRKAEAQQTADSAAVDEMSAELREMVFSYNQAAAEEEAMASMTEDGQVDDSEYEADREVATDEIRAENAAVDALD